MSLVKSLGKRYKKSTNEEMEKFSKKSRIINRKVAEEELAVKKDLSKPNDSHISNIFNNCIINNYYSNPRPSIIFNLI